jgi:SnoaL-like domain
VRRWELSAREQIRVLVAQYNGFGDRGQIAELSALFAPDGTLETHGAPSNVGPAAIEARLSAIVSDNTAGGTYWRHFVATHNVDVTSRTEATGTAYFQVLDPNGLNHWGRYRDRYRRESSGRWRFAHRLVRIDGYAVAPAPPAEGGH